MLAMKRIRGNYAEMAHVNKRRRVRGSAARLERTLQIVSRCNRALFQARGEQELLESICQILVETGELGLAWIGYCEDDPEKTVRPVARAGDGVDYLERVNHSWDSTPAGPVSEAIRRRKHCWVEDIRTDPIFANGRTEALALGYRSCVALPLVCDIPSGDLLDLRGALALYATAHDSFDEGEIERYADLASYLTCTVARLRSHLADDVSYGVSTLRARDERKRAEEALRRSENRLRLVVDTIPALVWSTLPDGSCDFVNQRWSEYTDLPAKEAAGSGWKTAFHPAEIGKHLDKYRASLSSGEAFEIEARVRRAADGEYRWFLIHGVPLRDELGNIVRWYGTATDIEDRKRAEEALRRSEAYLADAQRLSHTGSWAFNVATRQIIHSSEEHHRVFGFDPAAGMPAWDDWVQRIHPEDRERTMDTVEQSVRERSDFELDYRIAHPVGTIKHIHVVGHPVLNPSGDLVEFVGTSIDVTERRWAEERLQDAQNKLTHANRVTTMGQLAASIAHEVNQPIAAMVTNAHAALRFLGAQPPDLDEVRQVLGDIIKAGNRAGEIVGQIRALVKKKVPPRQDRLDMNEAILEVIALTRSEMIRNGVSLRTQLAKDLPSVQGDRIQLQQVMLNLIINAIEAMRSESNGTRELLIATGEDGSNGVRVAVRDSGPGLEPEGRLFDAFYTTKSGGMGMGLSICRSIIEAHGGRVWATANAPRGAVFQFNVPAPRRET